MKKAITLFCLLLISYTARAEEFLATIKVTSGTVTLETDDGKMVDLKDGITKLSLDRPSLVQSPIRTVRSERVLLLNDLVNRFTFRIPSSLMKGVGQFSVSSVSAEQKAHIVSTVFTANNASKKVEKEMECIFKAPVAAIENQGADGRPAIIGIEEQKRAGKQVAVVQVDSSEYALVMRIYNDKGGSAEVRTQLKPLVVETVLEKKTECQ
jgi:hypothetical protein